MRNKNLPNPKRAAFTLNSSPNQGRLGGVDNVLETLKNSLPSPALFYNSNKVLVKKSLSQNDYQSFCEAESNQGGSRDKFPRPLRERVRERGQKCAFTLAEVLITLGIIGVVAAITMPTLIANYQKHETVNRLEETYSILYQAIRMSETENGLLETWEIPNTLSNSANDCYSNGKIFFEQYLKPYIKIAKDCTASECWADNHTRPNGATFNFRNLKTYNIVLANGTAIGVYPRGTFVELYTDLNGKKGPNKHGRDYFNIVIAKTSRNDVFGNFDKSGVYMYGQGKNRTALTSGQYSCSKTATDNAGAYCGALIMHDGWKIEKDYPW